MGGSELGVLLLGSWVLRELRYLNPSNNKSQTPWFHWPKTLAPQNISRGLEVGGVHQTGIIFGHRNYKKWPESVVFSTFWLTNMLRATAAWHFGTSELPKWLRQCGVLCILTCTYASRHSRVAFWNIGTSKMAPPMWCFVHFDLQMCFAPQPRAFFQHRNFKNGSETVSFFCIFTCKCASRHSGVPFFNIGTSKSAATLRCFVHFHVEMCFAPQRRAIFS